MYRKPPSSFATPPSVQHKPRRARIAVAELPGSSNQPARYTLTDADVPPYEQPSPDAFSPDGLVGSDFDWDCGNLDEP